MVYKSLKERHSLQPVCRQGIIDLADKGRDGPDLCNSSGKIDKTPHRARDRFSLARLARKPLRTCAPLIASRDGGHAMNTVTSRPGNAPALANRYIAVRWTPTLVYSGSDITATWTTSMLFTSPSSMLTRVDSSGNINLQGMPKGDNFTDNVDIMIQLDTSEMVDQSGNPVAGRWALANESPGDGTPGGHGWFCGNKPDGSYEPNLAAKIPGMSIIRIGDDQVLIKDETPDNDPGYAYCLGLFVPARNYFMRLDPRITSKTNVGT
jgi:hypothetical protein